MATVGNLFVNVGASTQGLEKGLQKAQAQVKAFTHNLEAMGKTEAGGKVLGSLQAISSMYKKLAGDAEGLKKAQDGIAAMQAKLAETTKGAAAAEVLFANSAKDSAKAAAAHQKIAGKTDAYNRMHASVAKQEEQLGRVNAEIAKTAEGLKAIKAAPISSKGAAADVAEELKLQQKLNNLKLLSQKMDSDIAPKQKSLSGLSSSLQDQGVKMNKSGQGIAPVLKDAGVKDRAALEKSLAASGAEAKVLEQKIADAEKGLGSFNAMSITSAGGLGILVAGMVAAVGAAAMLTIHMMKSADELHDQAMALGVASDELQYQRDLMMLLGVASGAAESGMLKMGMAIEKATTSGDNEAFAKLEHTAAQLAELTPTDAFQMLIKDISKLGTQNEKIVALKEIFGKGGTGLLGAVNATGEEFAKAADKAGKLRLPADMTDRLAEAHDSLEAMVRAVENLATIFSSYFQPAVTMVTEEIFQLSTADMSGMNKSLQQAAMTAAGFADVIFVIYKILAMVVNIIQVVLAAAMMIIIDLWIGALQIVKGILWVWNAITGAGQASLDNANALIASAKALNAELHKGAEQDADDLAGHIKDLEKAGAMQRALEAGSKQQAQTSESSAKGIKDQGGTKQEKASLSKTTESIEREMAKMRAAARDIGATELEKQINKINDMGKGVDVSAAIEEVKTLYATIEEGKDMKTANAGLVKAKEDLDQMTLSAGQFAVKQALAKGESFKVAYALGSIAEETKRINDLAEGSGKFKDFMDGLNKKMLEVSTSREDQIRKMAIAAGKLGEDIDKAVANALKLEASIAETEKAKAQQENSIKTIEQLRKDVEKGTMGEKAFNRQEFMKGVKDPAQIAEYDKLQAQLDDIEKASGKSSKTDKTAAAKDTAPTSSISTAFGEFKFSSSVNEKMLSEAQKQTDLLNIIAKSSELSTMMSNGAMTPAAGSSATTIMQRSGLQAGALDPQMEVANKYLALIAANTAGTLS